MIKSLPFCVAMPLLMQAGDRSGRSRMWPTGTVLNVAFLDGTRARQDEVAKAAHEWTAYANLRFVFDNKPSAQIRVTFDTLGLWSYIGADALEVPPSQPTVGLGAIDKHNLHGAVLHVFGHVLGLVHEHQNPVTGIPWDKEKLYAYLAAAYGWTPQQVDSFIIARYQAPASNEANFDPKSIMLMAVPPELTDGRFAIGWNTALAESDKSYAARYYPAGTAPPSLYEGYGGADVEYTVIASGSHIAQAAGAGASASINVAGLESLGASKALVEEKIRLDVATPQSVLQDKAFDLAVAVVRPDAPPLTIEDLPAVSSEEGTVFRPDATEVIRYRIEVTGADCDVAPPHYVILLRPGENSKPRFFQVTAHSPGRHTINVNAYQEDDVLAAQRRILIQVQVAVDEPPNPPPSKPEVTGNMDIELKSAEVRQFKEALLSAFSRGDLEQVVYFGLDVRLDNIVTPSNYDKEATDLVIWANENNKVAALLQEARRKNPGNVKLREFDRYIQDRPSGQAAPPLPVDPYKGHKAELIGLLSSLPISATFNRRTRLLDGIPGADSIERDENSKSQDLNMMLSDLARRGPLANGELPIVKLIGNALADGGGYEVTDKLQALQLLLAQP